MLLEEKAKEVNFLTYPQERKTLERRITLKRELAEEINTVIAVFNKESEVVKINSSILINIGINCFFKQLEQLTEEEVIATLIVKALAEAKK